MGEVTRKVRTPGIKSHHGPRDRGLNPPPIIHSPVLVLAAANLEGFICPLESEHSPSDSSPQTLILARNGLDPPRQDHTRLPRKPSCTKYSSGLHLPSYSGCLLPDYLEITLQCCTHCYSATVNTTIEYSTVNTVGTVQSNYCGTIGRMQQQQPIVIPRCYDLI